MVLATTATFILLLTAGIFTTGYLLRENKKQQSGFLMLASFTILLLFSYPIITEGITYEKGTNTNTNYTYTTITNNTLLNNTIATTNKTYDTDTTTSNFLGVILLLIGLFGFLETSSRMYKERTDKNSNYRGEE